MARRLGPSWRWWVIGIVGLCLLLPLPAGAASTPQVEELSPEERVAQLFLVTWSGGSLDDQDPFWGLLQSWPVGGVVLQPGPDNPLLERNQVRSWVQELQVRAAEWSQPRRRGFPVPEESRPLIPFFIAVRQEGNGPPYDTLAFPYTLPSPMALGATWNPSLAHQVGQLMGRELRAWGVNLLLGPTLDVLDPTFIGQPGDLGVRAFGEHPYWVTVMAQSYVQGVHEGSDGQVAVVARMFPGYGGAARPLEEEIPTVPKPKEQVESTLLPPFFGVTGQAENVYQQVDGLLVGHIRSQAFQGTIRGDTPPLSLDPQALQALWKAYPAFQTWYEQGDRVFVSMDLGATSLKRYYQAQEQPYDPTQVALNAFLAGNDLLVLGPDFAAPGQDYWDTVEDVLQAFLRKYNEDPVFARRVDESVARILALKRRLYPRAALVDVVPSPNDPGMGEQALDVLLQVAQQSATLLVPTQAELPPSPPGRRDMVVVLADEAAYRPCPDCPALPSFPVQGFRESLLRLYGPEGGDRIHPAWVRTFTAADVGAWMADPENEAHAALRQTLEAAPWVIFLVVDGQSPGTQTLLQALEQFPELWRDKRVEVFSFSVPYALQPSQLAHVSAYYGLYSKGRPFLDIAARLLFRELQPQGASPVSVPALGYSITTVLAPDPEQEIPLVWVEPGAVEELGPSREIELNQTLTVQAGPVLDHNGHPVPDGTPLEVVLTGLGGEPVYQRIEIFTRKGMGKASFTFDRAGIFEIRARSGQAQKSQVLTVEVLVPPTPAPTPSPQPQPRTPTPALHPPMPVEVEEPLSRGDPWISVLAVVGWTVSGSLLVALWTWWKERHRERAWRMGLAAFVVGIWTYNLARWQGWVATPVQGILAVLGAVALTWLMGLGLSRWRERRSRHARP